MEKGKWLQINSYNSDPQNKSRESEESEDWLGLEQKHIFWEEQQHSDLLGCISVVKV